jgi:hypothetical protein
MLKELQVYHIFLLYLLELFVSLRENESICKVRIETLLLVSVLPHSRLLHVSMVNELPVD